jgi:hypothetical protein
MSGAIPLLPLYGMDRDNLTFFFYLYESRTMHNLAAILKRMLSYVVLVYRKEVSQLTGDATSNELCTNEKDVHKKIGLLLID